MIPTKKEYHVGIDYGTSNSCVGIFMNGNVHIVPNKLGERTTPSVVLFTNDNKILVGEDTITQKIDNPKNLIYEIKRFIGLSYEEFLNRDFAKYLNYDVVNVDNIPKIKININGEDYFYSAVEISAYILKKLVQNAEDFIAESNQGIKINKAVITVPAHFDNNQISAVKAAANLAGIEVARVVFEPTAAALSYGLGQNLKIEDDNNLKAQKKKNLYCSINPTDVGEAPNPFGMLKKGSSENAIVFDLGGGTLDVTLLKIKKNSDGIVDFDILATDGNIRLGGSDFDNKLIDFCIKDFCNVSGYNEDEIRQNKVACKRLKIKCERAKKLLSIMKETIINIDNFYKSDDLTVKISRDTFEDICQDLYIEIEKIIYSLINSCEIEMNLNNIDEVILVGGATKMTGIKIFLGKIFGPEKVKSNLNPDEAVAYGATLDMAKMEENDKISFNLQDIVAYDLGVETINEEMNPIIKKYSKIPTYKDKTFKVNLTEDNKDIVVNVYEGNNNLVKDNKLLAQIILNQINQLGEIHYNVKFTVDVNSKLTVNIKVESLGLEKEEEIKNVTHALVDKTTKKIRILKSKMLTPLISINSVLILSKSKLKESTNEDEMRSNLDNCIKLQEEKIDNYKIFLAVNETAYEYVYISTKELFEFYLEMFKLKNNQNSKIIEIIKKIKEFMNNLIGAIGYMTDLLEMLGELRKIGLTQEFYEIFVNYIELLNNEALSKKDQKYSRYYSKLYFERVFYDTRKYILDSDFKEMNEKIKTKYLEQKNLSEEELKKANSFAAFIERRMKEGKFIFGQTGFTVIGQKIEKFEKDMESLTPEELQEVLDIYENMVSSFDKRKYSKEELYCLGNIIFINGEIFKRGYKKLYKEINRFETILAHNKDLQQDWIGPINEIISELKDKNNEI